MERHGGWGFTLGCRAVGPRNKCKAFRAIAGGPLRLAGRKLKDLTGAAGGRIFLRYDIEVA